MTVQFLTYCEIFLSVDCVVLFGYNIYVLIKRKVYESWSTTSLILSCSLLLIARFAFLVIFATRRSYNSKTEALVVNTVLQDLPCALVQLITLALIWQWYRIGYLLKNSEASSEQQQLIKQKSAKGLITLQICLVSILVGDILLLILHFVFDCFKNGEYRKGDIEYSRSKSWDTIRTVYKVYQFAVWNALLFASIRIFNSVSKVVRAE